MIGRLMRAVVPATAVALLALALPVQAEDKAKEGAEQRKDMVQTGDAVCTRCHDETEPFPVLAIGKTKHGTVADARTGSCVSCHGESPTHISKPEGVSERPKPTINFGKKSKTPVAEQNAACLTCHKGGKLMLWAASGHEARDVACTSCHSIHVQHDKVVDRTTQPETCFTCHKEQRAQINRPSHHPVKEGKVVCSDCHNSHGSAGPKLMVRDSVVNTCYTCHMEKRGPFIWNHQPVTEDCSICHNPHGSVVDKLLKARAPFLCQQCHERSSHQGNIPNTTINGVAAGAGLALGRSCVNCHSNIHGGNNPVNDSGSRSFRR